jgi:hypothetical protein
MSRWSDDQSFIKGERPDVRSLDDYQTVFTLVRFARRRAMPLLGSGAALFLAQLYLDYQRARGR